MGDAARFGNLHPADARGFQSRRPPPLPGKTSSGSREESEGCRQEAATQAPRRVPGPPRVPKPPVLRKAPKKDAAPPLPPPSYKFSKRPQMGEPEDGDVYENKSPVRNLVPDSRGVYQNVSPTRRNMLELPTRRIVSESPKPHETTTQGNSHYYETVLWSPEQESTIYENSSEDSTLTETMTTQSEGPSSVFQGQSLLDANTTTSTADSSRSQAPSFIQTGQGPLADLSSTFDSYFGYEKVISLTADNFHNFIANKDLVMIMFYDPFDPITSVPKNNFKKAMKKRGTDLFAAVDCQHEPDFCADIDVKVLPSFRFYSWGKLIGTIRDMSHFDDNAMISHLDTLGSLSQKLKFKADTHFSGSMPIDSVRSKCSLAKIFGFKK